MKSERIKLTLNVLYDKDSTDPDALAEELTIVLNEAVENAAKNKEPIQGLLATTSFGIAGA